MDSFSVGEVAIVCNCVAFPQCNGDEVTILALPRPDTMYPCDYEISCPAHLNYPGNVFAGAAYLRKKRPPEEYDGNRAGEWNLCPWRPSKERVA